MSINSIATRALIRSKDYRDLFVTPREELPSIQTGDNQEGKPSADGINKLVQYIPTESVTLYVSAMAAAPAIRTTWAVVTPKTIYWLFGLITPALVFLIFVGKRKAKRLKAFPSFRDWPWWEMVAAFVAFLVWALAVPSGPYMQGQIQGVISAFLAVFISTILSLMEPLFAGSANA